MINYSSHSDELLIELLQDDDNDAFTEIYNRYWKKLLVISANKLNSLENAEEIIHDIFVMLWIRRNELEIRTSLSSYLAVSVKYRVIKTLDKYYNQQKYIDSLVSRNFSEDTTSEWVQFNELKDQLSAIVADLPEKCRLVYKLSRESNYSQKEIAEELQISEKTVEAHLSKATKILRVKLSHHLYTLL